jgi:hypothetical protein
LKHHFCSITYQQMNPMASTAAMYYAPGDFSWIDVCPDYKGTGYGKAMDKTMLSEAYNAINKVPGGWAYLSEPDAVGEGGFMYSSYSSQPDIRSQIDNEIMKTESGQGHSGGSYGLTMRTMELIAKQGWLAYIRRAWPTYTPPQDEFHQFITNLQTDPIARQQIPDIDQQAEAMRKFAAGKLSYAEMRSLCG